MSEVITSTKNETVKMVKSLQTRKGRLSNNAFLVEGEKNVIELMTHQPDRISAFFVREDYSEATLEKAKEIAKTVYYVATHVMNAICDCKTPQGIAAIASPPIAELPRKGFILALEDVQDPKNVGTMIRTADAAGCSGVVLSKDCADFLSPQAVRASMGSIFHISVIKTDLMVYLKTLVQNNYHIVSAHLSGSAEYNFEWEKTCLIIGNESRGISKEISQLSMDRIKIPMYGKAESLNAAVAAGILIYKIRT